MTKIKNLFLTFKKRLVSIGSVEPLNKLSLLVIIALDVFILFVVFQGLDDHTRQLVAPHEYVPYACKDFFIKRGWSDANFLDNLQPIVLSEYNNVSYRYDGILKRNDNGVMHDSCKAFYTQIKRIAADSTVKEFFIERQELIKQKKQFAGKFIENKGVYDTSLMEKIAKQEQDNVPAIQETISSQKSVIEKVTRSILNIESKLTEHHLVIALKELRKHDTAQRQEIIDDFKKFQAIYPLKELAWQLLFMLPLFFIFYMWSSISVKKSNRFQVLIASHLLVVASIPIILKIAEVVLDLIPRHFFRKLFKILESLHIIALWHYIVIFVSVCAALFIVYIIQKKIFNKERLQQKRLIKGACYSCGKKLPRNSKICPFCGCKQFKTCMHCEGDTFIVTPYCRNCGKATSGNKGTGKK